MDPSWYPVEEAHSDRRGVQDEGCPSRNHYGGCEAFSEVFVPEAILLLDKIVNTGFSGSSNFVACPLDNC